MVHARIEISPEDIFINTRMMAALQEKLGYGQGFSLIIDDISVEMETRDVRSKRGSIQRTYVTVTLLARIERRPPVVPFTVTKSGKHISPKRFVEEERWAHFFKTLTKVFGRMLTLYIADDSQEEDVVKLRAIKQFKRLDRMQREYVLDSVESLRTMLPLEIGKPPQQPPTHPKWKIEWWKEYIKSLDRVMTSEEVASMPLLVLPHAMYHDLMIVSSELVHAIIPERLLSKIRTLCGSR